MVPLQVILLAVLVFVAAITSQDIQPVGSPWLLGLTVAGSHLALVLLVARQARLTASTLHQPTASAYLLSYKMERLIGFARWVTVVMMGVQIWGLGWASYIFNRPGLNLAQYSPLGEMLLMTPTLLTWVLFWAANYQVERAIHDRSLAYRMAMGIPVHDMPTMGQYLSMQVRHNYFLLIPMMLAMVYQKYQEGKWAYVDFPIRILVLFTITPFIITRVWQTSPMTGELRDRLIKVARKYRVKFRNVLIWHTHHHVRNAAVVGHLPFARYFIMSDALLETLTDRQIEAVFAHEVGHAKHKHLWWYSAALLGTIGVAVYIGSLGVWAVERGLHLQLSVTQQEILGAVVQVLMTGLIMGVCFSRLSKRFEHQADWFAAQHMAESLREEPVLEEDEAAISLEEYTQTAGVASSSPPTSPLSSPPPTTAGTTSSIELEGVRTEPTVMVGAALPEGSLQTNPADQLLAGAVMFSKALQTIVELSSRSLDHGGWLHPSVRLRAALLEQLAMDPEARRKFEKRMIWTRVWIVGIVLLAIAAIGPELRKELSQSTTLDAIPNTGQR